MNFFVLSDEDSDKDTGSTLRVILVKVRLSKHVVEIKVDIVPEIDNE